MVIVYGSDGRLADTHDETNVLHYVDSLMVLFMADPEV